MNGSIDESQYTRKAKLKIYKKITSFDKLKYLIKLYSKIERSYENIVLCKYCIKEFCDNSSILDKSA